MAARRTPPPPPGLVLEATERAIAAATHLTDMDAGAVAVLRNLARTIDAMDEGGREREDGTPIFDNVSIPTYLKACEQLGLTPSGRVRLVAEKAKTGGKLGQLRAIRGGADVDDEPKPAAKRATRRTPVRK